MAHQLIGSKDKGEGMCERARRSMKCLKCFRNRVSIPCSSEQAINKLMLVASLSNCIA